MLPSDAPDSLIALALQCVSDDISNRPSSGDMMDWLQDLHDTTPEDSLPPPILSPVDWGLSETSMSFGGGEDTVWTAIMSADSSLLREKSEGAAHTDLLPVVNTRNLGSDTSQHSNMTPNRKHSPLNVIVTPNKNHDSPLFNTPFAPHPLQSPTSSPGLNDEVLVLMLLNKCFPPSLSLVPYLCLALISSPPLLISFPTFPSLYSS
jgi:hypothetical protein